MRLAKHSILLALTGSCAAALGTTPVSAAAVLGSTACSDSNVVPTAVDCSGWYQGNLNSGNATDLANEALIVNALLGTSYTGANLPFVNVTNLVGSTITFAQAIAGTVILGVHVGAANGAGGIGYDGTAFFKLVNPGSSVTLNVPGLSNARIFSVAAVPEPATWAMLLFGLGSIAWTMRRRRHTLRGTTTISYNGLPQVT